MNRLARFGLVIALGPLAGCSLDGAFGDERQKPSGPALPPGELPGWSGPTSAPSCAYPAGPYGVEQGQTVAPNLSWEGYRPGAITPSSLTMAELFDCDGSRGIHAILLVSSQHGCAPCREEANGFEARMASWGRMGIAAAILLLDDDFGGPPTIAAALGWKHEFDLESVGVFIDPAFSLVPGDFVGTPMQTVIDPRTMKVIQRVEGLPGDFATLESLAFDNGAFDDGG